MIIAMILMTLFVVPKQEMNSITKNGMTVSWEFRKDNQLYFKLFAPTKGWVAIGLNTKNKLVGSNLIMASNTPSNSSISDRYIVGFGNHQPIEKLGARPKVKLLSGLENKSGTTIAFLLETVSKDAYHFNLEKGQVIYLTMAYSQEDDFMHHSIMRTSVKIFL